ncbi:MAG: TIR domain-containing protein [Eubacterium sp.]|nr:TIR domain-containing protein [Eubacterium sp.]
MIDHYNAFISYKHAPEDNRVAEAIHKGLERFHIPEKIQKKTGLKRINRIFRDTEELPITSDLNDTIANALANSDYLIVICSTNTKQSIWVTKEIEIFLRNHTKKQIYTVLVNGEPFEVIPEVLLYEDSWVLDQYGKQQLVRMPIEPLSCDYRMPIRKADKIELPRLASGIIGCSYDELMNRRRQYMVRQLTLGFSAAFALMIGFTGYLYYSRNTIHKNYIESLKNQSRYLANESERLLDNEQRITALQLALEALPKDVDDDRPVIAEAIKAISDATLAYEGENGSNIHTVWNYRMPNRINDFRVSPNGATLTAYDNANVVEVWNTKSHDRILYLNKSGFTIKGLEYLSKNTFVIWTDDKMECYETDSGSKKWEYDLAGDIFVYQKNIMVGDGTFYIGTYNKSFLQIDSETGEVKNTVKFSAKNELEDISLTESKLSPDGTKIAFIGILDYLKYSYGVVDIATQKTVIAEPVEAMVKDIEWVGDSLMVASSKVDFSTSSSIGNMEVLTKDYSTILCLNPTDLKEKWKADFVCNGVQINSDFLGMEEAGSVAYFSGNVATIYDLKTGAEKYVHNVNESIIYASDKDDDGLPIYLTNRGGYSIPAAAMGTESVYHYNIFTDELNKILVNEDVFVSQKLGSEVIEYGLNVYDDNWTEFKDNITVSGINNDFYMNDQVLGILYELDDKATLATYGLSGEFKINSITLPDEKASKYKILGCYKNCLYLGHDNENAFELISVDIMTGEQKVEKLYDEISTITNVAELRDTKLVINYRGEQFTHYIGVYDLLSKEKKEIEIPSECGSPRAPSRLYDKAGVILYSGDKNCIVDINSGDVRILDSSDEASRNGCISQNGTESVFALADRNSIRMVNRSGEIEQTIDCAGLTTIGMTFIPERDEFIVLFNDGSLYWYSSKGEFKRKTDVTSIYSFTGNATFDIDNDNNLMYIQINSITDVVDMESGVQLSYIEDCFGHHKISDSFITQSYKNKNDVKIGYYKRYSVDELIEKAKVILQDAELSEELKTQYGIED